MSCDETRIFPRPRAPKYPAFISVEPLASGEVSGHSTCGRGCALKNAKVWLQCADHNLPPANSVGPISLSPIGAETLRPRRGDDSRAGGTAALSVTCLAND